MDENTTCPHRPPGDLCDACREDELLAAAAEDEALLELSEQDEFETGPCACVGGGLEERPAAPDSKALPVPRTAATSPQLPAPEPTGPTYRPAHCSGCAADRSHWCNLTGGWES